MAQPADLLQPCTRQSAIWRHIFVEDSGQASNCAAHPGQFAGGSIRAALEPQLRGSLAVEARHSGSAQTQSPTPPPKAFEYSEAYATRRKIHFYASFATLPLFVTQYVLGDKLYDGSSGGGTKSAHSAVAVGIEALFGVNTVTGVWNMWESRKDPNGRTKRLTHSLMMLGADVGFVATGLLAPDDDDEREGRSTHRNAAIGSMAVAAVSYAIMLIGR
jgi:hypothetical protein